jgi:hypothetical protein
MEIKSLVKKENVGYSINAAISLFSEMLEKGCETFEASERDGVGYVISFYKFLTEEQLLERQILEKEKELSDLKDKLESRLLRFKSKVE